MKTFTCLNLFLASICYGVVAHAHVQFEFGRRSGGARLVGRDSESAAISGGDFAFVVNATVGTPGQEVSLLLSPSVADTWVPDATASECDANYYSTYYSDYDYYYGDDDPQLVYCHWGSFNKSESSTYLDASQKYKYFAPSYFDGSAVDGVNGTDTLAVGGIEFENFPIGLVDYASITSQWIGVLGLGRNTSGYSRYNNFPDRLLQAGKINTKAYSIWLDDPEGSSGSILFGAIDTSKYEGNLVRIDGYASYTSSYTFGVQVTGFNGSSSSTGSFEELAWNVYPFDATIGPAETYSNLPQDLATQIWDLAGATYNFTAQAALIPCDAASTSDNDGARFTIELWGRGGPVLDVQLSDLIVPRQASMGTLYWYYLESLSNMCICGVQNRTASSTYSQYYNLGSSLLRRSYMVFDLENREVALAPTKFTDRGNPTVVEFASSGAPAPSATRFCGPAPSGYSNSCDPYSTGGSGGGGSDSGSSNPYHGSNYNRYHDNTAAIALGTVFGVIAVAGLVAAVIIWKRICCGGRDKSARDPEKETSSAGAATAQGGQSPVMGARQPLSTIPELNLAEAKDRDLPPLPPREQGATSAIPTTNERGEVVSTPVAVPNAAEAEPSAAPPEGHQEEPSITPQASGKGRAVEGAEE